MARDIIARPFQRRPDNENPFHPSCKLHLQRICGTCAHYQGELRPSQIGHNAGAGLSDTCSYFGNRVFLSRRAWKCHRWTRKTAAPGGQK